MSKNTGKVSQVIGPVVDVTFENNEIGLPDIYDSLEITRENGEKLILEIGKLYSKRDWGYAPDYVEGICNLEDLVNNNERKRRYLQSKDFQI